MELRTFISRALLDIVNGVADAQGESKDTEIIPSVNTAQMFVEMGITQYQLVKFEVQVRVDESKGSEGKIGVVSSIIGASMAGKSSNESEHTTTLHFSVPVMFASHRHKHRS
jgi:hypothetical protein